MSCCEIKDDRDSCWTHSQSNKDPFLDAWLSDIPKTVPSKAVWEYSRHQKTYLPYKWGDLTMNPIIPSKAIDKIFQDVKEQLP